MGSFLLTPVVFFISFLVTITVFYFKVPVATLQQIVLVLVIILIIFLNKFLLPQKISFKAQIIRLLFLFLTSLLVQVLIISSGGFKSPFLILLHLYTLGVSFLVGFVAAFTFLLVVALSLVAQVIFDENIKNLILEDVGLVALYGASLLVIIPLSVLLSRSYNLKDRLLEFVKRELRLKEIQHQTLLQGISNIIFIIDKDLEIVSTNEAAQIELSLSESGIIGKNLFNVLFLRDIGGGLANTESLSIERVIQEKTTRIVKGLSLLVKNKATPRTVDVQLRPMANLKGEVDQIMVIVGDGNTMRAEGKSHFLLEEALLRQNALANNLKKQLIQKGLFDLKVITELVLKGFFDISLLREIEDHPIKTKPVLVDISTLCSKNIALKRDFAHSLGVELDFTLLNFNAEDVNHLIPKGFKIETNLLTPPFFTAPLDVKWFDILLSKLLDLTILLVSGTSDSGVILTVEREGKNALNIKLFTSHVVIKEEEKLLLFKEYYGSLSSKTNLRLGSGLEGLLVKNIALILNIPLYVETVNNQVAITLKVNKLPSQ